MNNYSSLYDLDELVLKCRSIDAKSYLNEALICYKNKAYRASIVNLWIAIVYDFIRKIELLAASGVNEAKGFETEFKKVQSNLHANSTYKGVLDFEKTILDKAKKLQLIDAYQYEDLYRLYNDRNRCAHPSFNLEREPYQPSAELVRLHLRNCIDYVLSRDLVQGKIAVDLFNRYVYSQQLPTDIDALKNLFISLEFNLIPEKTLTKIISDIIFNKLKPQNGSFSEFYTNLILSLKVMLDLREADVKPKLSDLLNKVLMKSDDEEKKPAFILVLNFPGLVDFNHNKNQLFKNEIESILLGEYSILNDEIYRLCAIHPEFKNALVEKIEKADVDEILGLIKIYQLNKFAGLSENLLTSLKKRVIEGYKEQRSYDYSNKVSDALVPLVNRLDKNEQLEIIKIILNKDNSQTRGAFNVHNVISEFYKNNMFSPEHLQDKFICESVGIQG